MTNDAKTGSANLYIDTRSDAYKKEKSEMHNWDQTQLEEAVNKNEDNYSSKTNSTEKVCKFFLDAVEKKIYGWFWVCPNSYGCIYRHCLPPGFVLKSEMAAEVETEYVALEEKLDIEVKALLAARRDLTPITLETFLAWKKIRQERQNKERELKRQEHLKAFGYKKKLNKLMDGRSMFVFQKVTFDDDEEGADDFVREEEDDDPTMKVHNLDDYIVKAQAQQEEDAIKEDMNEDEEDDDDSEDGPKGDVKLNDRDSEDEKVDGDDKDEATLDK